MSLSWDPVKAMENESDVIGYKVSTGLLYSPAVGGQTPRTLMKVLTGFIVALFSCQVLLRQEGRGHSQVMRTPNSAAILVLPEGGTYIIEVRAVSEGGEGAASSQIRVLTSSGAIPLIKHTPPILHQ